MRRRSMTETTDEASDLAGWTISGVATLATIVTVWMLAI